MPLHLDGEASYLLTGGLGGLGKPIATWLVEHGARSLIFISRSAGKKVEDQEFFRELESSGCSVSTVAGFVESMEDVQKAIGLAPRRIAGVIHLAMILRVCFKSLLALLASSSGHPYTFREVQFD
ncbi:hypothetical protein OCU04_004153 [Sclerotinia nivalis]|uniref:Ketoreductase domain-containing protein n=1 Tax=Sclerotinia nivalis TaxID=352851 RepID=A0A9X0DLL4_9HELO|nr:hypothetical protein OCU04_004153 [Sclerotinia nivalis]